MTPRITNHTISAEAFQQRRKYRHGNVNIWDIYRNLHRPPPKREHQGIPGRRFRFDYADPNARLAIEYEGTVSSKSRHLTLGGYAKDCEKYNLAALHGWTVIRFTALHTQEQVERWVQMFYANREDAA